jgi:hypothetical protein
MCGSTGDCIPGVLEASGEGVILYLAVMSLQRVNAGSGLHLHVSTDAILLAQATVTS